MAMFLLHQRDTPCLLLTLLCFSLLIQTSCSLHSSCWHVCPSRSLKINAIFYDRPEHRKHILMTEHHQFLQKDFSICSIQFQGTLSNPFKASSLLFSHHLSYFNIPLIFISSIMQAFYRFLSLSKVHLILFACSNIHLFEYDQLFRY